MGQMLNAYLGFDAALRAYQLRVGSSPVARDLVAAGTALRRVFAALALREEAQACDPRADIETILLAAIAAGIGWPDLAALVNRVHEQHPGR